MGKRGRGYICACKTVLTQTHFAFVPSQDIWSMFYLLFIVFVWRSLITKDLDVHHWYGLFCCRLFFVIPVFNYNSNTKRALWVENTNFTIVKLQNFLYIGVIMTNHNLYLYINCVITNHNLFISEDCMISSTYKVCDII